MISAVVRIVASWRYAVVGASGLGVLACASAALALGAAPAFASCSPQVEQLRGESSANPVTGQPFSAGLPDCRAYEMVSPQYKQSSSAQPVIEGIPVAPDGERVGFQAEGDFGEPENYTAGSFSPALKYLSHRTASGWLTSSTFAPAHLVALPGIFAGLNGDFSPDLRSVQLSCGVTALGKIRPNAFTGDACATRAEGGPWTSSGIYPTIKNLPQTSSSGMYLGASADGSRIFIQPTQSLLEADNLLKCCSHGIYEVPGVGSSSPLRLVNVDNTGKELATAPESGGPVKGPFIGDEREVEPHIKGTAYQAISRSGETVFFTATPETANPEASKTLTLYARLTCASGANCVQGRETIAISNPSLNRFDPTLNVSKTPTSPWECSACKESTIGEQSAPQPATYQGASADGSKVFFTTTQKLLSKTDSTLNLYEYDLTKPPGEKLVLLSPPTSEVEGAVVKGVLRTSSDGGVVYFVAGGVLKNAAANKTVDAEGKVVEEIPTQGKLNLYASDTETGEVKFVAVVELNPSSGLYTNGKRPESLDELSRHAQTTPDGRYLVFSSGAVVAGDTNGAKVQAVYRYDFQTSELIWVSHAAPSCEEGCAKGGANAWVAALPGTKLGAEADIGDWNRALSGCPVPVSKSEQERCPKGQYDGEYIIFTTAESLQNSDKNKAPDVYEWHCTSPCPTAAGKGAVAGTVGLISDGHNPAGDGPAGEGTGTEPSGMSASGSDIFFFSSDQIVGQDPDRLTDVYDARINGGFPRPEEPPQCVGAACQGAESAPSSFGSAASSVFGAGGNLSGSASETKQPPKPETEAQHLARAIKACKNKAGRKRAACELQARKKYGAEQFAKALKACKSRAKSKRAVCRSQARKKYGR